MNITNSAYYHVASNTTAKHTTPSFKGVTGQKALETIIKTSPKEKVVGKATIASLLALVGGVIGLNKEKVADVFEEFANKIQSLMGKHKELESQNLELETKLTKTRSEKDMAKEELEKTLSRLQLVLQQNAATVAQKDAKIAELQKYEAIAKVKSIDEIDTVMPEQFIATLKEIEEHNDAAYKSLFDYIMTGKGQEEFLAQMGRNEILLKGRKDGIDNIPEVKDALAKAQESVGLPNLGYDSYLYACRMLGIVLSVQPKASYIQSPAIYAQVKANAKALIEPMMDKRYTYSDSVEKEMEKALDFRKTISNGIKSAKSKYGFEYVSETTVDNSTKNSFVTFKNNDGNFVDYSLNSIYAGFWGEARIKTPEGEIIHDYSRINK
jgi:hypothetical protein